MIINYKNKPAIVLKKHKGSIISYVTPHRKVYHYTVLIENKIGILCYDIDLNSKWFVDNFSTELINSFESPFPNLNE